MTADTRLNRRTILKTAAVGAAAAALPQAGQVLASSTKALTKIDFWGPGGDPVGGPIILKLINEFNSTAGKASGIFVNNHFVSTDNAYIKYTTGMTSSSSP